MAYRHVSNARGTIKVSKRKGEIDKFCYIFELFTPKNLVIVRTNQSKIIFHGCRNMRTLQDVAPDEVNRHNWELAPQFPYKSLEECIEASKKLLPTKQEGFVVVDKKF